MKKILGIILLLITYFNSSAQELNCQIQIASSAVQTNDRRVFNTLQTAVFEFMNQTKWTNYVYKIEERIECSILINITKWDNSELFEGTIQVQSTRPIYKTSYNSTLLNYLDKDLKFSYIESEPLDFQINSFSSNLTSVLAYYAYVIIGLDFDSFSLNGGSPYYNNAQTIVNNAQATKEPGWKAYESQKNRYWLVENLLNSSYSEIRQAIYNYHRLGLDVMSEKLESGRGAILGSLELLQKANREKPNLFILTQFLSAKSDELINIFSGASPIDKPKAVNILKELDPSNANKYQKIMQGK